MLSSWCNIKIDLKSFICIYNCVEFRGVAYVVAHENWLFMHNIMTSQWSHTWWVQYVVAQKLSSVNFISVIFFTWIFPLIFFPHIPVSVRVFFQQNSFLFLYFSKRTHADQQILVHSLWILTLIQAAVKHDKCKI